MPRKTVTVLTDDYDGKELPEDTKPVTVSVGAQRYSVYLSNDNFAKLLDALEPFVKDAESASALSQTKRSSSTNKDKMKAVRAWAIATGYKFKGADGTEKTLGERGRIPDEVVEAYDKAN